MLKTDRRSTAGRLDSPARVRADPSTAGAEPFAGGFSATGDA